MCRPYCIRFYIFAGFVYLEISAKLLEFCEGHFFSKFLCEINSMMSEPKTTNSRKTDFYLTNKSKLNQINYEIIMTMKSLYLNEKVHMPVESTYILVSALFNQL